MSVVTQRRHGISRRGLIPFRYVLPTYVLLMPLTYAFAPAAVSPLPLLWLAASLVLCGPIWRIRFRFRASDVALAIGLVWAVMIALAYPSFRSLSHSIAVFASVFFYFFLTRVILSAPGQLKRIGNLISAALLLVSMFVITESLAQNLLDVDIYQYIPRPGINAEAEWTVGGSWHRARGTAEEPAHTALFFELALPLSLLGRRSRWRSFLLYGTAISAYLLLFSSASIVALVAGALFSALVTSYRGARALLRTVAAVLIALAVVAAVPAAQTYLQVTVITKIESLIGVSENRAGSAEDRTNRFSQLRRVAPHAPFGVGWGTTAQLSEESTDLAGYGVPSSYVSLYGDFFAAGGIITLAALLLFIVERLARLALSARPSSRPILAAIFALSLHYAFVGNYWYPFLWFGLAVADVALDRGQESQA